MDSWLVGWMDTGQLVVGKPGELTKMLILKSQEEIFALKEES